MANTLNSEIDPLADAITKLLHELDPMNTCCNVNTDMEDEYAPEAKLISAAIRSGVQPVPAVKKVFDDYFWVDCLKAESVANIAKGVQALLEKKIE